MKRRGFRTGHGQNLTQLKTIERRLDKTATRHRSKLIVNRILQVHEPSATRLGLDRLEEDRLILAFGRWAEGQIKKWIDYAKGVLLFVMVPDDPESGMFYVYDRAHQAFWMVDPVATSNFGGYRLEEFEQLAQTHGLKALAQNPTRLVGAN